MAQEIFTNYQTEQRWSDVEAAMAALAAKEDAAASVQGLVFAANQDAQDAQNALTLAMNRWRQHCANRTPVAPPGGGNTPKVTK
jgi:hypothetical protein